MSEYKFKGYDYSELAECWGLEAKVEIPDWLKKINSNDDEDENENMNSLMGIEETVELTFNIGYQTIKVSTDDSEQVEREKIRQHIAKYLLRGNGTPEEIVKVRSEANAFLLALVEGEYGYSAGVYKAISEIESNHTFAQWMIQHMEGMWT